MIQNGEIIKIKYSKALLFADLCELVGREAMVTKVVHERVNRVKGVCAIPQSGRLAGQDLFIPAASIVCIDDIKRLRTLSIMKTTSL